MKCKGIIYGYKHDSRIAVDLRLCWVVIMSSFTYPCSDLVSTPPRVVAYTFIKSVVMRFFTSHLDISSSCSLADCGMYCSAVIAGCSTSNSAVCIKVKHDLWQCFWLHKILIILSNSIYQKIHNICLGVFSNMCIHLPHFYSFQYLASFYIALISFFDCCSPEKWLGNVHAVWDKTPQVPSPKKYHFRSCVPTTKQGIASKHTNLPLILIQLYLAFLISAMSTNCTQSITYLGPHLLPECWLYQWA